MGKITVETCEIEGLKVITPTVYGDARGYFVETYNKNDFVEAGIDMEFVQDNQSASKRGVLRGLHFQKEFPQVLAWGYPQAFLQGFHPEYRHWSPKLFLLCLLFLPEFFLLAAGLPIVLLRDRGSED